MTLLQNIQSLLIVLLALGFFTNLSLAANEDTSRNLRMADEIPNESFEVPTGDPYLYFINSLHGSSGTVDRVRIDDVSTWEELVQIPEYQDIVHGISVDVDRDRIFYTTGHGSPNESSVWEASLKGENPEQLYLRVQGTDPDPPKAFGSIEALGGDEGDLIWLDIGGRRIWLGDAAGDDPISYGFEGREWLYIGDLYGLAIDMQHVVALVSDWEYSRIYQVTPAGDISLWMDQGTNESFFRPAAMAIDNVNGWLYWVQHNGLWRTRLGVLRTRRPLDAWRLGRDIQTSPKSAPHLISAQQ